MGVEGEVFQQVMLEKTDLKGEMLQQVMLEKTGAEGEGDAGWSRAVMGVEGEVLQVMLEKTDVEGAMFQQLTLEKTGAEDEMLQQVILDGPEEYSFRPLMCFT